MMFHVKHRKKIQIVEKTRKRIINKCIKHAI